MDYVLDRHNRPRDPNTGKSLARARTRNGRRLISRAEAKRGVGVAGAVHPKQPKPTTSGPPPTTRVASADVAARALEVVDVADVVDDVARPSASVVEESAAPAGVSDAVADGDMERGSPAATVSPSAPDVVEQIASDVVDDVARDFDAEAAAAEPAPSAEAVAAPAWGPGNPRKVSDDELAFVCSLAEPIVLRVCTPGGAEPIPLSDDERARLARGIEMVLSRRTPPIFDKVGDVLVTANAVREIGTAPGRRWGKPIAKLPPTTSEEGGE